MPHRRIRPKRAQKRQINVGAALIFIGVSALVLSFLPTKITPNLKRPSVVQTASKAPDLGPIKIDPALLAKKESFLPPERIIIPNQKINLPVVEAKVVDGYWELSETTASHGVGSANPGEIGNTVIFAHAREGLFLPLKDIQADEEIFVLAKDKWFRYRVKEIKDVTPDQVEVIAPTSDETLTLYTCSGFLDSKRRIVIAKRWL